MTVSEQRLTGGQFDRWFEAIWLVTLASVPLSLRWIDLIDGTVVAVPLELLLPVCGLLIGIAWVRGRGPDRRLIVHPVSVAVALGLLWTVVTSMTSVDPSVSLRYSIARTAYVLTFFVGGLVVFSHSKRATKRVVAAGVAGFFPVVAWTVWHHAPDGFSLLSSIEVGRPFYPNHLEYGMTLAYWMLVLIGMAVARWADSGRLLGLAGIVAFALIPVLWAAHARSAWVALVAGGGLIVLRRLRVGIRWTLGVWALAAAVFFALFAVYFVRAENRLSDVHKVDGRGPEIVVDSSIRERLNRWSCAVRMVESRPVFGFGPGTFETSYGVFQHFTAMTAHSSLKGDRGDAHSEYFSAIAEQGVIGFFMVLGLFGVALRSGYRATMGGGPGAQRWIAIGWTAALVSLAAGNLFNSFFEVDRVAPFLWIACAAVIVLERDSETTILENH